MVVLSLAGPARAADLAQIGCALDGVSEGQRAEIAASALKMVGGDRQAQIAPEDQAALQQAAVACQARYSWSDEATASAIVYTNWAISVPGIEKYLHETKGINSTTARAMLSALTPAQRDGLRTGDRAATEAMLQQLQKHGVDRWNPDNIIGYAQLTGVYSVMDVEQARFAAN